MHLARSLQPDNASYTEMKTTPLLRGRQRLLGAIGFIILWLLGVPGLVLFVIFLLRGCD